MIDGSHLDYEENILLTKKVVDYARAKHVSVEAELGIVGRPDKDQKRITPQFTDPNKAEDFIKRTGCDSLAIAIGTSHGAYKYDVEKESDIPNLRFDILQDIITNFALLKLMYSNKVQLSKGHFLVSLSYQNLDEKPWRYVSEIF